MGRADSPLRDRVVFIQGAPRSGTTWLVTLLAAHPDIAGVDAESHLFDFGVDRLFDNLEGRHPLFHGLQRYLDRAELVDLTRDLTDGVFTAMRAHLGGDRTPPFIVEKTPVGARDDGLDLERKRDVYPDAWYLHIVRDREAVIGSLMRAPFMADRSREAAEAFVDRHVGNIRRALGDLPRYREVAHEELLADPVRGLEDIFGWLGLETSDATRATLRELARERVSEMGVVVEVAPRGSLPRRALRALRDRRRADAGMAHEHLSFSLLRALYSRDEAALRALTHPKLEFVYREGAADRVLEGEAARAALFALAQDAFTRRYVREWWGSSGIVPGAWWSSAPRTPFGSIFFSALTGDATRVDIALAVTIEGELIRRVVAVSAGPLAGRPTVTAA
jgi:hypothetical protein